MAKQLKITRGSFYHHFKGREDFLRAMLDYWMQEWTLGVRDQVRALGLDPANMLLALVKTIRHRRAAHYDAAVRAWAMGHDLAAVYLRQADTARLAYIKELFAGLGFEGTDLETRARLFLYYEAFDPMMGLPADPADEDDLIRNRLAVLTRH